jgi:phasin family protein
MNPKPENTMSRIADDARGRYARIVKGARKRTESAADRVAMGKKPVKAMTSLGLKLTAISHKTADQVLKQQTRMVEHQIDAVAQRLKAVADARNLGDLVRTQIRLIPQNVSRFAGDTRATLGIVAGAGFEVRDVLKSTIVELRGKKSATRKTGRKKIVVKKAPVKTGSRKTARKTAKPRRKTSVRSKNATVTGSRKAAA